MLFDLMDAEKPDVTASPYSIGLFWYIIGLFCLQIDLGWGMLFDLMDAEKPNLQQVFTIYDSFDII